MKRHACGRAQPLLQRRRTAFALPRTEAAIPLSVSVHDGHVCVSAGFARLADSSTSRSRPPFLASRGARHAKRRRGVSVRPLKSLLVAFAALLEQDHRTP